MIGLLGWQNQWCFERHNLAVYLDAHGHGFNTGLKVLSANLLSRPEGGYVYWWHHHKNPEVTGRQSDQNLEVFPHRHRFSDRKLISWKYLYPLTKTLNWVPNFACLSGLAKSAWGIRWNIKYIFRIYNDKTEIPFSYLGAAYRNYYISLSLFLRIFPVLVMGISSRNWMARG